MSATDKKDLKKILTELKQLQDEYKGREMPTDAGERFDRLASEAAVLQAEQDREMQLKTLEQNARRVDRIALPAMQQKNDDPNEVVGYLKLGEAFTGSEDFKRFAEAGYPQTGQVHVSFAGSFHTRPDGQKSNIALVPVTRQMLETKAIPTIGAGVIRADRLGEVVRFAEQDRLMLRDVVNVSQTTSNSIEYVTIESYTRAAAGVAEGALKPEAAITYGTATAPVRTLAVWMPVTEQQLQDVPQVQNTIDNELTWDLKKHEEEQIGWGDGTGQNLLGIFNTPGVTTGRTEAGDTILDQIRRMITDVAVAGLQPNAVALHPYDWEAAQLVKGTDDHYVWAIVTNENGSRIWGTRVVETIAMQRPGSTERRALVGDFMRGATLWDRQQAGVQVGYINDQFIRNMRTIRAEERVAFGVKRPAAFRYQVTAAAAV